MTIRQYSKNRGITYEAVRKQIIKYSDQLEGCISKQGNVTWLNTVAIDFLDSHRLPRQTVLSTDTTELQAENDKLKNKLEALQALLAERDQLITDQQSVKTELATTQGSLKTTQDELRNAQRELAEAYKALGAAQHKIDELTAEIAATRFESNPEPEQLDTTEPEPETTPIVDSGLGSFRSKLFGLFRRKH